MILNPDTDFFRYFNDPTGLAAPRSSPQEQAADVYRRRLWQSCNAAGRFSGKVRKKLKYISNITASLFAPHSAVM